MANSIPVINNIQGIDQWRQALNANLALPATPKIPWNYKVSNKQGGNYLTWDAVAGADGYIVEISSNGDFSTGVTKKILRGNNNTSYFDTVPTATGAAPPTQYYQVRATAGTATKPQSVLGIATGVIASNAIAPNDTVTASTTAIDTTTNDTLQRGTGTGDYRNVFSRL